MDVMEDTDGNITLQIPTTVSLIEASRSKHLDGSSISPENTIARSKSSIQFEPRVTINVDVECSHSSQPEIETPPNFLTSSSSSSVQGHLLQSTLRRDGESLSDPNHTQILVTKRQTQLQTIEDQASSPSSSSSNSPSSSKTPIPPPTTSVTGETPRYKAVTGRNGAGVKLEPPDDMKDYVETTMNELLGWYGLPSVDKSDVGSRHDTASLATRNSPNNPVASSPTAPSTKFNEASGTKPCNDSVKYLPSNRSRMIELTVSDQDIRKDKDCDTSTSTSAETKTSNDSNNNASIPRDTHDGTPANSVRLTEAMEANKLVPGRDSAHEGPETLYDGESSNESAIVIRPKTTTEDEDDYENYSRGYNDGDSDDVNDGDCDPVDKNQSLHRHGRDSISAASNSSTSSNTVTVLESNISGGDRCSWCQKTGNKQLTLETPTGIKVFCSELCFTQCRRASFKKNKVCDWCKHARHTVNFVDFQDGDTQLQFCSEKCLNQYKMNIFCKEAQEHLQHFQELEDVVTEPIRHEEKNERKNQKEILITPELWLAGNNRAGKGQSNPVDCVKQELDDNSSCQENENPNNRPRNNGVYVKSGFYSQPGRSDDDADNEDINDDKDLKDDNDSEPGEIESVRRLQEDGRLEEYLGSTDDEINHAREKSLRKSPSLIDHLKSLKTSKVANSSQKGRDGSTSRQILTERDNFPPRTHGNKAECFPSPGKSGDDANNDTFAKKTTDLLLQQWAASRLLSLVPEHMRGGVTGAAATGAITGMGQPLGHLPYGANPLLYSNLFRLPPPHTSPPTSSNAVNGGSMNRAGDHKVKSRHESRRELLRDRDLFHTRNKKSKSITERGRPETSSVPLSPSTSHSSAGTPGPSHLTEPDPLATHLSAFGRSFPHSLLVPNSSHTSTSAQPNYLKDPAHASAFFQLQLALQQSAERHSLLFSDAGTTPQPTLPSSKTRHSNGSHRVGEASTSQGHPPSAPLSTPYNQQYQTLHNTPQSSEHQPNTSPLFQLSQGVPPVTVLVPYPVAIPIPLPFPFPIPITPEKFYSSLARNSESNEPSSSDAHSHENGANSDPNVFTPSNNADGNFSNDSNHFIEHSPSSSPSPFNSFQPNLNLPGSSFSPSGTAPGEEESVMSLRREGLIPFIKSPALSTSSKRSISETITPFMFDLSKKSRLSISSSSNDEEAMDLSKQSTNSASPKIMTDLSEKENDALVSRYTPTGSAGNPSPENLVVPKIHIVSDKTIPPLSTPPLASQLALPLEQSTYSSRRSRILDAPSVPRLSRMPSPERRYVRNVPKDMVEAAKRRGLRARIKTK